MAVFRDVLCGRIVLAMIELDQGRLEALCRQFDLTLVVLFGSQAKGRAIERSDVDLAVWTRRHPIALDFKTDVLNAFMDLLVRDDVDVVLANHAEPILQMEIAQHGEVLYESERSEFAKFQLRALKAHEDARKLSRWQRDYVEEFARGVRERAQR